MKRNNFFTVLLLAAAFAVVSCEKPESVPTPEPAPVGVVYVGEITVAMALTSYVKDSVEITVKATAAPDSVDLLLSNVKFAEKMPAISFIVPNVYVENVADSNNLSALEVVPVTIAGVPMPNFTITNLSGTYTTETLHLTFTSMGLPVTYRGVKK